MQSEWHPGVPASPHHDPNYLHPAPSHLWTKDMDHMLQVAAKHNAFDFQRAAQQVQNYNASLQT